MSNSPNLNLPYLQEAQAQKHVTVNDALRILDALVNIRIADKDLNAPPASPADGERYIVAAAATGLWAGKDGQIAAFQDGAWMFYAPAAGWLAWVADEAQLYGHNGSAWIAVGDSDLQNIPALGVNAVGDSTNRITVSAAATLLNHEGTDHQLKINKNTATDTASLLFQSGFSGRAEFGATGDDDFHVKVSPDGFAWNEALIADRNTGVVRFPAGMEHVQSRAPVGQFLFTPGGDDAAIYRNDTSRSQNPRIAVISSIASDTITLTTTDANLFFADASMNGVSYLRIWNISKTPEQSAWVKASPSSTQLQVVDETAISGWLVTETIQAGEPTSIFSTRVMTLDISPMLQNVLGAVFRQKGIFCKAVMIPPVGTSQEIDLSPSGAGGTFVALTTPTDGSIGSGLLFIPCTELSPISNSNLVMIRESDGGGLLGVTFVSPLAVVG